jgi:hypothetical protein
MEPYHNLDSSFLRGERSTMEPYYNLDSSFLNCWCIFSGLGSEFVHVASAASKNLSEVAKDQSPVNLVDPGLGGNLRHDAFLNFTPSNTESNDVHSLMVLVNLRRNAHPLQNPQIFLYPWL